MAPRSTVPRRLGGLSLAWVIAGLALAAALGWSLRARPLDRTRVYRIGYNQNPPFQIHRPGQEPTGFSVETVMHAARRAGIRLEWVYDETRTADKLFGGQVELWPMLADLPERHGRVHVSAPYIITDYYLFLRKTGEHYASESEPGVAYTFGPALHQTLLRKAWPHLRPISVRDPVDLTAPFCRGDYQRVFVSSYQSAYLLREMMHECPEVTFRPIHGPQLTLRLGVGARLDRAPVADALRDEILRMAMDGDLGAILARYSYVGLTENRTTLQMIDSERQARTLTWAVAGLATTLPVMIFLVWRLRRARRAAEQASIAKSEFLANMSHEIRTPLGGVIGMIELAQDNPLPPASRDPLETARSSAHTLLAILNDISISRRSKRAGWRSFRRPWTCATCSPRWGN